LDIDLLLLRSAKERGTPQECVDRIGNNINQIRQQSPGIGDRLRKVMAAKYGVDIA
jgi:hypothetical protein